MFGSPFVVRKVRIPIGIHRFLGTIKNDDRDRCQGIREADEGKKHEQKENNTNFHTEGKMYSNSGRLYLC